MPDSSVHGEEDDVNLVGLAKIKEDNNEERIDKSENMDKDDLEEGQNSLQTTLGSPQLSSLECSDCGKKFTEKEALTEHQRAYSKIHPYNCQVCGKAFKTKEALIRHRIVHTGARPYSCDLCGKKYRWKKYLAEHKTHHCSSRQISSINRDFHTTTSEVSCWDPSLPAHNPDSSVAGEEANPLLSRVKEQEFVIGMATELAGYKVEKSPNGVDRVDASEKNKNNQSSEKTAGLQQTSCDPPLKRPLQCQTCGMSFNRKSELLAHKPTHTGGHPACEFCGKHFINEDFLLQHRKVHTKSQCFLCEICGKRFNKKRSMRQHKQVHIDVCPSRRQVCIKESSWLAYKPDSSVAREEAAPLLSQRKKEEIVTGLAMDLPHMAEEDVENSCVDTLHTLPKGKNKDALEEGPSPLQSVPVSLQQKPHQCGVCGKGFNWLCRLHIHERIHTGVRPYCCDVCEKGFNKKGTLHQHQLIHTGIRCYNCEVCGRSIRMKCDLNVHQRVHTYSCDVCSKGFMCKMYLLQHKSVHTGTHHYSCETCGKSFTLEQSLGEHKRLHSANSHSSSDTFGQFFLHKDSPLQNEPTHEPDSSVVGEEAAPLLSEVKVEETVIGLPTDFLYTVEEGVENSSVDVLQTFEKGLGEGPSPLQSVPVSLQQKPHQCGVCGKGFNWPSKLHEHQRIHTVTRCFSCEICGNRYKRKSELNRHQRIHPGVLPYSCDVCGKRFMHKTYLLQHKSLHHYSCEICGKSFTLEHSLSEHKRLHSENGHFSFDTSGPIFLRKNSLLQCKSAHKPHSSVAGEEADPLQSKGEKAVLKLATVTGKTEDNNKDGTVGRVDTFRDKEEGSSLLRTRPHQCAVCGKGFHRKSDLHVHEQIHTGILPYCCEICRKGFKQMGELLNHERLHSCIRPYRCQVCGKGFKHKGGLRVHGRGHTSTHPRRCEVCGKGLKHKCDLHAHERIHTGISPYCCDVCSKNFTKSQYLHHHKLMHIGAGPYSCGAYGKCFTNKKSLYAHERFHMRARPYTCDVCGKSFVRKTHILRHMSAHTRSLPYSCEVCGKGFVLEDNLTEHKRLHSKDCHSSSDACGQIFPHKDYPLQSKPAHEPDSSEAGEEAAPLLREVKVEDEEADPLLIQEDDRREPVPSLCQEVGTLHNWVSVKGFESLLSLVEGTEPVSSLSQEANHQADLPSLIQAQETCPLLSQMKVEDEEVDPLLIQEEDGREPVPSLSQVETEEAAPLQSWIKVEEEVVVPPTVFANADQASSEASALDADEAGDPLEGGPSPLQSVPVSLQQKPHQCGVCGKGFNWPSKLHEHQRIHTVTRCFSCEICGNRYKRKSELNRHQRIHPGVLPYSCDVCGKRFMHKTYLLQHKSLHHYSCEICGKSFTLEQSLSEHKRLHSENGHFLLDTSGLIFLRKGSPLQNEPAHKHDSSVAGEQIDPLQDDRLQPVPSLCQVESEGAGPLESQ